jgi:intraflagellar transport protein 56
MIGKLKDNRKRVEILGIRVTSQLKLMFKILSRAKPASEEGTRKSASRREIPTLEKFLALRDYTGALTLLEFNDTPNTNKDSQIWIAYCAFHLGDYKKAVNVYLSLKKESDAPMDINTYVACCYFYLGMYPESQKMLNDAPESQLKTRLSLHLAYKLAEKVRSNRLYKTSFAEHLNVFAV